MKKSTMISSIHMWVGCFHIQNTTKEQDWIDTVSNCIQDCMYIIPVEIMCIVFEVHVKKESTQYFSTVVLNSSTNKVRIIIPIIQIDK